MRAVDLHNNIAVKPGIYPAAATTDNTAFVSQIVNRAGYEACEFLVLTGSLADADATFALLFEDGNDSALSDHAEVAAGQLIGTEALAGFTFANDNACFKIGYSGTKQYCRVTITPAANTGNAFVSGVWVLGSPHNAPTANPPT
jgi:hypothetical protein